MVGAIDTGPTPAVPSTAVPSTAVPTAAVAPPPVISLTQPRRSARMTRVSSLSRGNDALATLHRDHYASMVRLAVVVLGDLGLAEQVVQDAFVKLQVRWGGIRDIEAAPAYLRSAVLNGARSQLRRHKVRDRFARRRTVDPATTTPEASALVRDDQDRMVKALRQLSDRQREALTLRYYLDLPEAEIAATMGVSQGSVKTHLHRGLANLAAILDENGRSDKDDGQGGHDDRKEATR
jgi:RNA polymerase sigma-70 factor (sigma-E family)